MPVQPTYPGVYIEELPSGVRTITGVSTSVAAFLGTAKRGPINRAVHILGYADFERRFGGLSSASEMSYGVRQFFLNGGTDAWVIRLAGNPVAATKTLQTQGPPAVEVLDILAVDEGSSGNQIEVRVSHQTANPASNFDLALILASPESPSDSRTEVFENLSMNSKDQRYVVDVVNGASQLVRVERKAGLDFTGLTGTSISGQLTDVRGLVDGTHNRLFVSVNGGDPVPVELGVDTIQGAADADAAIDLLCGQIQSTVADQAIGFTCEASLDKKRIVMTSGQEGEESSVRVLPAPGNDVSARLKLGTAQGGSERDAAAGFRPREIPDPGSLEGGVIADADLDNIPGPALRKLRIVLNGGGSETIDIGNAPLPGGLEAKLEDLAGRITTAVRDLRPSDPAYANFQATAESDNRLLLRSGTRGAGSAVEVGNAPGDTLATQLKLLGAGATVTPGKAETLEGGSEQPIADADLYKTFIGDRAKRTGMFALESVDLFNLLCMPGITEAGILADADSYCRERRAFLIIDAPPDKKDPAAMVTTAMGTALPKSDHAAVYYPWVRIADPLKGGKLRTTAPSGTIAGLYARTDASRGVWKAPAGTEATLSGVLAAEHTLTDRENGTLNPLGVNCIRVLPVYGAVSWGARTLRGADAMTSEWKYIPVRRLALYIEESLYRGTQWVVFEPNDEPLWAQIRLNIGAFMNTLFRQGAFQGRTPREAYLVKCDRDTTTQDDINRGIVNIVVGFAPLKPAEFVILKIQQLAGQLQT